MTFLLGSLLSSCAGVHSRVILEQLPPEWTFAYANGRAGHQSETHSSAYLASSKVPWFVDLRAFAQSYPEPQRSRELRELRRRIYDCWNPKCTEDLEIADYDRSFIGIALAGGGSRAAVFSTAVMYELDKLELLQQTDVISGISGGAIAAALYGRTCDRGGSCPPPLNGPDKVTWDHETQAETFDLLEHRFIPDILLRSYLDPWSTVKSANTYFDRTDVMAETFGDVIYGGIDFRDLNPVRPNIILNATNQSVRSDYQYFRQDRAGVNFPISLETFAFLGSDLHGYPLAYGVAGSNALPGGFHPLTLRNFRVGAAEGSDPEEAYVHLADGGVFDRTGVCALMDILAVFDPPSSGTELDPAKPSPPDGCGGQSPDYKPRPGVVPGFAPEKAIVIAIDGGNATSGEDQTRRDTKSLLEQLFNANAFSASNLQLDILTDTRIDQLQHFMQARHSPDSNKTYATIRFALSALIEGINYRDLSCNHFDEYFDAERDRFFRDGAFVPSRAEALRVSRDKIEGRTARKAIGDVFPASLKPGELGRLHLWCDIQKATQLSLNITRQSIADLRTAAAFIVEQEVGKICRFASAAEAGGHPYRAFSCVRKNDTISALKVL